MGILEPVQWCADICIDGTKDIIGFMFSWDVLSVVKDVCVEACGEMIDLFTGEYNG